MRVLRASPFAEVLTNEDFNKLYNMHHAGYSWGRVGGSSGSELEAIEEFEGESDEEEAEVGGGPLPIIGALRRRGFESVAIKLAVARGNRDENKLTNMVFFGRHPER